MSADGQWESGRRRPPARWRAAVAVATLVAAALIGWALGGDDVGSGPAELQSRDGGELEVEVVDATSAPDAPAPAALPASTEGWHPTTAAPAELDRVDAHLWLGDRVLVLGGVREARAFTYEPATGLWRRLPDPPARGRAGVWDEQGRRAHFLAGGIDAADGALHVLTWLDGPGRWSLSPPAPRPPAEGEVLAWRPADEGARRGTLYVAGGIEPDASPATPLALHGGRWAELSAPPVTARRTPYAVWTGGELLVIGGEAWDRSPRSDAAAYDPLRERWREVPDPPVRFGRKAAYVWTGTELIAWSVAPSTPVRPPGWSYDPRTDAWSPMPRLDGLTRHAPAAGLSAHGSTLALWGGVLWRPHGSETDEPRVDGAVVALDGGSWRRLPAAPLVPRGGALVAWTEPGLLVWGGSGRSDGATYSGPALAVSERRGGQLSER